MVTLESISAVRTTTGVHLQWTTLSEVDTIGFRLLRETSPPGNKSIQVVEPLIPAAGSQYVGASYEHLDNSQGAARSGAYYLEDIDIFGKVTRHGPILVPSSSRKQESTWDRSTKKPAPLEPVSSHPGPISAPATGSGDWTFEC